MHHRTLFLAFLVAFAHGTLAQGQVPPVPALPPQVPSVPQLPGPPQPAQPPATGTDEISGCRLSRYASISYEQKPIDTPDGTKEKWSLLIKEVRVDCDQMQFFADEAQIFHGQGRVTARGNVLFISGGHRITAERMDFDYRARTGTFYDAHGIVSLGDRADRSLFGTQEPDAMFWGKEVQKVGPREYRISDGGFTTCVQPTPRWQVSSGTLKLVLDDYALMTNSVFRVKGVPLLYLPAFYYPIQEDDRATGFLIPIYGNSTVKGQSISIPFFWALGRSHDALFSYDWLSKAGYGYGSKYRYQLGSGSAGSADMYFLNEKERVVTDTGGVQHTEPASRSYTITGGMTQNLGGGLRARANANYFSDIRSQQRYQQDIYRATSRNSQFGGNLTGNWAEYVVSGTLDRNDIYYPDGTITTSGGLPRVTVNRGERPIGKSRLYFGATGEYITFLRSTSRDDVTLNDQGLTKMEFSPTLRIPFTKWPFFTVNSSVSWRATYWTESLNDVGQQVESGLGRQYVDLTARIVGPVFHRIFDRPDSGYATKLKHVIEPTLVVQRISSIDEFDRIVKLEGTDFVVGNVTRFTYGLNNRLYAKKDASREILSVTVAQTYYSDENASQYDRNYQSSFSGTAPTKYSPVGVLVRASPTTRVQGEFRTEWDHTVNAFRKYEATGMVNSDRLLLAAGWSHRRFIEDLPGFDDPNRADHYLNASTTIRTARNRVGGIYSFNYDLLRDNFLQQRYLAYYNAQCCGFSVEYQTFAFNGGFGAVGVGKDRRFNISFSLAGIGSFSNALGALAGSPGR